MVVDSMGERTALHPNSFAFRKMFLLLKYGLPKIQNLGLKIPHLSIIIYGQIWIMSISIFAVRNLQLSVGILQFPTVLTPDPTGWNDNSVM